MELPKKTIMIATALLSFFAVLSAFLALVCGMIIRASVYLMSQDHSFAWDDEPTRISAVIAGLLFALFFVLFAVKPLTYNKE